MYILRVFALLLFLTRVVLAQQPTPILRDAKLTPGDTFDVAAEDVCVPGYAKKMRAVPACPKRQAYAEYGIRQYKTGDYELDHLIPLSLGGCNSIRNLWPQSTKTSPGPIRLSSTVLLCPRPDKELALGVCHWSAYKDVIGRFLPSPAALTPGAISFAPGAIGCPLSTTGRCDGK
jgi:hypothetical protein